MIVGADHSAGHDSALHTVRGVDRGHRKKGRQRGAKRGAHRSAKYQKPSTISIRGAWRRVEGQGVTLMSARVGSIQILSFSVKKGAFSACSLINFVSRCFFARMERCLSIICGSGLLSPLAG